MERVGRQQFYKLMKMAQRYPNWNETLLQAISPFPTVFSKDLYCRHVKTRACLGKG